MNTYERLNDEKQDEKTIDSHDEVNGVGSAITRNVWIGSDPLLLWKWLG
jgi:hypothetical protein